MKLAIINYWLICLFFLREVELYALFGLGIGLILICSVLILSFWVGIGILIVCIIFSEISISTIFSDKSIIISLLLKSILTISSIDSETHAIFGLEIGLNISLVLFLLIFDIVDIIVFKLFSIFIKS